MRIIAGQFRGRTLKSPPDASVRPTSDRLRETLFNVIAPRIKAARFLDLCAGSGAVGVEALSRSAHHVTFVERSARMCALIKANLELCRIEDISREVVNAEASAWLRQQVRLRNARAAQGQILKWDIAFFDPPYADDYQRILDTLASGWSNLFSEDGLLIVEHDPKKPLPEEIGSIIRTRVLKQGDSALSFYGNRLETT